MKRLRLLALLLAGVAIAPALPAQLPQTDLVANRMVQAIAHSKQKSVIVFDFSGPDGKLNGLGEYLAGNLNAALAQPARSFLVLDREKISAECAARGLSLSVLSDVDTALWIGRELGAQTIVLGHLAIHAENLDITFSLYRARDLKPLAAFQASSPISAEMRTLLAKEIAVPTDATPSSGTNGYTYPRCRHCPQAAYSQEAVHDKFEGTVVLIAVVGIDGKAREISVQKELPYGLTKQALEAVTHWTFKPAADPQGTPTAVRQVIEVSFHLY